MLKVRTKIGISPIHGIGLFADEQISNGTIVWQLDGTDQIFWKPPADVDLEWFNCYSYHTREGFWVLCSDNSMFTNHSDCPNLGSSSHCETASRDINVGEELTIDYAQMHFPKDNSRKWFCINLGL